MKWSIIQVRLVERMERNPILGKEENCIFEGRKQWATETTLGDQSIL
jgi:hypothetical protein